MLHHEYLYTSVCLNATNVATDVDVRAPSGNTRAKLLGAEFAVDFGTPLDLTDTVSASSTAVFDATITNVRVVDALTVELVVAQVFLSDTFAVFGGGEAGDDDYIEFQHIDNTSRTVMAAARVPLIVGHGGGALAEFLFALRYSINRDERTREFFHLSETLDHPLVMDVTQSQNREMFLVARFLPPEPPTAETHYRARLSPNVMRVLGFAPHANEWMTKRRATLNGIRYVDQRT